MATDTIPTTGIEIPEITQVGFVVEDLEDGMERFGSILGIAPWEVYRFEPPKLSETTYRGEITSTP
jgi:methylmalonyl-CoA/ethylmalonyl-CoA epimerase